MRSMYFKKSVLMFSTLLAVGLVVGCESEKANYEYMPDMAMSPAMKAQKIGAMRVPVKGTISRDFVPYAYVGDPERAGRELKNPLLATASVLERGKSVFNTYCIVCHGTMGVGNGPIVPKFPKPLSLQSDRVRGYTDGRIYHVIVSGQNMMPSYASQIAAEDRWALIHYVRALQRAAKPSSEDLKLVGQTVTK